MSVESRPTGLDDRDPAPMLPADVDTNPVLSRWVKVRADDVIEIQVGKVELGQGILTALSQVAADALAARLDQVQMVAASTDGPDQGVTSGSMSTTHTRPALDVVCGNVRALFIEAAARRWGVDPDQVDLEGGIFRRGPGPDAAATYGALTADVDLEVKADAAVSAAPPRARTVGTSVPRIDLRDRITGRPTFIHDLRLPGMMFGRVVRAPSPGARLTRVDPSTLDASAIRVGRSRSSRGAASPRRRCPTRSAVRPPVRRRAPIRGNRRGPRCRNRPAPLCAQPAGGDTYATRTHRHGNRQEVRPPRQARTVQRVR